MGGEWRPIDSRAKARRRVLVRTGDDYATAYWTGGSNGVWAYPRTVHQINFEPREYRA